MTAALGLGQASGRTALAIAAFMSRPANLLSPAALDRWLADVGGHDLRPMLAAQGARTAVEAHLARATGAASLDVDDTFLNRLRTRATLVSAVEIALAPFARLDRLKAYVVGAVCREAVRGALLKADRQVITTLLGADVQEFSARQATIFYPALADLAPQVSPMLRAADGADFAVHPVAALAAQVIASAIGTEAPLAAAILTIRESGAVADGPTIPVTAAQCAEVFRLWQREAR